MRAVEGPNFTIKHMTFVPDNRFLCRCLSFKLQNIQVATWSCLTPKSSGLNIHNSVHLNSCEIHEVLVFKKRICSSVLILSSSYCCLLLVKFLTIHKYLTLLESCNIPLRGQICARQTRYELLLFSGCKAALWLCSLVNKTLLWWDSQHPKKMKRNWQVLRKKPGRVSSQICAFTLFKYTVSSNVKVEMTLMSTVSFKIDISFKRKISSRSHPPTTGFIVAGTVQLKAVFYFVNSKLA